MSRPTYTLSQFLTDYPNSEACLEEILRRKYSDWACKCGRTKLYKVKGRPVYACACGAQMNPLAGTVMDHTKLPLTSWFYVMYLFSVSKNGVSAAEVQRHLGCKYKTAWRMCYRIRESMKDDGVLEGDVEVDETYIRAKPWRTTRPLAYNGKARTVIGLVERGGRARAVVVPTNSKRFIKQTVRKNVVENSNLYTDGFPAYQELAGYYRHQTVNHSKGEWVRGEVHTQNVENLWHGVKLGIQGTHKGVSPEYLDNYLANFTWLWSEKASEEPLFYRLLERV